MNALERRLRQHCVRLLHALARRLAAPEPDPEPPTPAVRRPQENPWAVFRVHHSEINWGADPPHATGRRPAKAAMARPVHTEHREAA